MRQRSIKLTGATLLSLLLLTAVPGLAATETETPKAVVQQTIDQVTQVLANKGLPTDQRRKQIEEIVYAHFDFAILSKLVLARHWKELSPEQQQAFVDEFKRHLSMTYGKNVESYNDERAVITAVREEKQGDWTVKSKVVRKDAPEILVDYRLRLGDGRWQVIDVIIEGVSLVANFRSQFQEILGGGGGPDKLIKLLKEKNAKGEPLKKS